LQVLTHQRITAPKMQLQNGSLLQHITLTTGPQQMGWKKESLIEVRAGLNQSFINNPYPSRNVNHRLWVKKLIKFGEF
jgi:hypothetical protein